MCLGKACFLAGSNRGTLTHFPPRLEGSHPRSSPSLQANELFAQQQVRRAVCVVLPSPDDLLSGAWMLWVAPGCMPCPQDKLHGMFCVATITLTSCPHGSRHDWLGQQARFVLPCCCKCVDQALIFGWRAVPFATHTTTTASTSPATLHSTLTPAQPCPRLCGAAPCLALASGSGFK